MDFLYPHGGPFGYGNSNLDTVFRFSEVFPVHAILHDAAGAVYAGSERGTGKMLCVWTWTQFIFFGSHHETSLLPVFEDICTLSFQSD